MLALCVFLENGVSDENESPRSFSSAVAEILTTPNFYEKVLGMKAVRFGVGRIALEFGNQKINLHQLGNEFEPKAQNVRSVLYYRY
ncbi:MAG TPA: hypothetical protein VJY12_04260 [Dysgonamonadaceae bacterium]|nr:hypothetical protein [Dysgonamonadaceae bacterium]